MENEIFNLNLSVEQALEGTISSLNLNNYGLFYVVLKEHANFHFFRHLVQNPERTYYTPNQHSLRYDLIETRELQTDVPGILCYEFYLRLKISGKINEYDEHGVTFNQQPFELECIACAQHFTSSYGVNREGLKLYDETQYRFLIDEREIQLIKKREGWLGLHAIQFNGLDYTTFFTTIWNKPLADPNDKPRKDEIAEHTSLNFLWELEGSYSTLLFAAAKALQLKTYVGSFEDKVKTIAIRERMLGILAQIDKGLATQVAYGLGLHLPADLPTNQSIPADGDPADYQSVQVEGAIARSEALSMANTVKDTIKSRKIAILAADGANAASLNTLKAALLAAGAVVEVIAPRGGLLTADNDEQIEVDQSFLTAASVLFDAVYVAGGTNAVATLEAEANAVHFLNEAFKHCKAIAAHKDALQALEATYFSKKLPPDYNQETVLSEGILVGDGDEKFAGLFIKMIAQHRFWEREKPRLIPA